jgi:orotate phosphoribosyltransferase
LNWRPDVIAGTATAGIPHAAWVADRMDLPMVYIRAQAKDHGKGNQIEGRLEQGQKVVLIEDLISTGGSSLQAAQGVIDGGGALLGVAAIFTYGLSVADRKFKDAAIPYAALTDFRALMAVAEKRGTLTAEQAAIIASWQDDPGAWSVAHGGAA